jgi:hypothetical protein
MAFILPIACYAFVADYLGQFKIRSKMIKSKLENGTPMLVIKV